MEKKKSQKPYTSPKMEIVELNCKTVLMEFSGTIGLHDSEKDYLA